MTPIPGLSDRIPEHALQPVACGMCGSSRSLVKFRDEPFAVVTCQDCELTYVTPRLDDEQLISEVYDEGYWSSDAAKLRGYTNYRDDAPLYLKTYRRRLSVIRRHFREPGRVLDIGCAAGYFLSVMKEEGWQVTGLEPSDPIRAQAEERLGAENLLSDPAALADLEPGSFDLVTLWDVIEHIPDFLATLRTIRGLLSKNGRLLIETQNIDSRAAAVLGKRWQHYKHAEHIYHFNPKTIGRALGESGFDILENTPRLGGKYVSMGFIAERAGRLHPILSTLLSPLKLFRERSVYVNLRDEMIVVARPQ